MTQKQIAVDELDFDAIKENLKNFLRGQSQFDAYDFEGSAMNTLLDILAYNTHYNLLYTNLAVNESFLDSASKRSSIVSIAKSLGYMAQSTRSARAKLNIVVTLPVIETPSTLTIPRGTIFAAQGDPTYYFSTLTDYTVARDAGVYTFTNVEVVEGVSLEKSYTMADEVKFVIPMKNVDTTTLLVTVKENFASVTSTKYTEADDLLKIDGTDNIYFLKQREDLYFEVYFGNGAIGSALSNGNVVKISYLASSGSAANGANYFTYQSGFRSDVGYEITTVQSAFGGVEEESNESIRFNAPRAWVAQNRAVTNSDYESILLSKYPRIESISAWGGQDNVPKVYGKVFISVKPFNGEVFSASEKADMLNTLLLKRGVVSVIPELVDPDYLNIELECNLHYNANTSRFTSGQLATFARNKILEYSSTLNKFDSVFRFSRVTSLVDGVDDSVVSNSIKIRVRTPMTPKYTLNSRYKMTTNNPIAQISGGGGFYSTRFFISGITDRCYVKDDGLGTIKLYSEDESGTATYIRDIGTMDYSLGEWDIPSLTIETLHDPLLEFVFYPYSNDVVSNRNMIVTVRSDLLVVNSIADKLASGEAVGGSNFTFTAIR